jgi:ferritin-like metal-binding protein YciE
MTKHAKLSHEQEKQLRLIASSLSRGTKMKELVNQFKKKFPETNFTYRQLNGFLSKPHTNDNSKLVRFAAIIYFKQ